MSFLKMIFNINNAEGIRESMRDSYKKHCKLSEQGKIPETIPHTAGLYGALSSRYIVSNTPKSEPFLWCELTPFLLMNKSDSVETLVEYIVCKERPNDGKISWLRKSINNALSKLGSANEDRKILGIMSLIQSTIYWLDLLDQNTLVIIQNEFIKMFPSRDKVAPEIYDLIEKELQIKISTFKS